MKRAKKPHYTLEFKQDAVKLVLEQGYTHAQASESLGVSVSALRRWINAERRNSINPDQGQSANAKAQLSLSEHEELLRLRKEVNRLKMEREILKKATVFFIKESE